MLKKFDITCAIFIQNYLRKREDTYSILQNKYLCIYEDSFGLKILRDDCARKVYLCNSQKKIASELFSSKFQCKKFNYYFSIYIIFIQLIQQNHFLVALEKRSSKEDDF